MLGNSCDQGCFKFNKTDPENLLNRIVKELPARPDDGGSGVDLIAEPWAIGEGTYRVGDFPSGWAEWNGKFRESWRKDINKLGVEKVSLQELADYLAGSPHLYQDDGRKPWHSVNFFVAHDGFTLNDLFACNEKNNSQPWPYGPSDGGEDHNISWDHNNIRGDQIRMAKNAISILAIAQGVPMILGGDELLRSQRCNNNTYNLDSTGNWLRWSDLQQGGDIAKFHTFLKFMFQYRSKNDWLRRSEFFSYQDGDSDGIKDVMFLNNDGTAASQAYLNDTGNHFFAMRLDNESAPQSNTDGQDQEPHSLLFVYNGWQESVDFTLPAVHSSPEGLRWMLIVDTDKTLSAGHSFAEEGIPMAAETYTLGERSVAIFEEK